MTSIHGYDSVIVLPLIIFGKKLPQQINPIILVINAIVFANFFPEKYVTNAPTKYMSSKKLMFMMLYEMEKNKKKIIKLTTITKKNKNNSILTILDFLALLNYFSVNYAKPEINPEMITSLVLLKN